MDKIRIAQVFSIIKLQSESDLCVEIRKNVLSASCKAHRNTWCKNLYIQNEEQFA